MKNLFLFILSFLVSLTGFAQDVGKQYFEDDSALGGDAVIKSASVDVAHDEISKTFEIEILEDGAYYLDAWMVAPLTKEGYSEYKIAVNNVLSGFTFKPQTDGWQSLALTDAKKSAATVNLVKGTNMISVIGKGPEIPNVEFVKLSSNLSKSGISDSNYRAFVESVKSNALNELIGNNPVEISSNRGVSGEIYTYYLDIPVLYTTNYDFNFIAGETVKITTNPGLTSPALNHAIEFFNTANPETYSWHSSTSSGNGSLTVTIPVKGTYHLCLRIPPSNSTTFSAMSGFVNLTVNNSSYANSMVSNSVYAPVTVNYSTPSNFYICKISVGNPYLYLENSLGNISAFSSGYGVTSDGYQWGRNSRIITNLTNISYGHVFAGTTNIPSMKCDLYMGLAPVSSSYQDMFDFFPLLPLDNSFFSGTATDNYKCIDWSVGKTYATYWLSTNDITAWDNYYKSYGYTRVGATAENAAIALWMLNGEVTHASVRKHSTTTIPHGFEWESKCGGYVRIMHTRDALNGNRYGSIAYYYQPISGSVSMNFSDASYTSSLRESNFSISDLNQIASLKGQISAIIITDFNANYLVWKNTWRRPEIAIYSNPYKYAESTEYESLLNYCMKYGKAIWPLLIDKLVQKDILVLNLLKDLTYGGNRKFIGDITPSIPVEIGNPLPSLYSNLVDYCKGLLAKEEINIQKSIRDISTEEKETFEANVTVDNSGDLLLSLHSEKNEKAVVAIYDVFGRQEYKANHNLSRGNQTVMINTSNFKKGIYVVKVTIGNKTKSQTISI